MASSALCFFGRNDCMGLACSARVVHGDEEDAIPGEVFEPGVPAIRTCQLGRIYHAQRGQSPRVALDRLDLSVHAGEVHGLLGPNGAGKTTLCKVLTTALLPTSGRAAILGHDVVTDASAVRPLVGVVLGGERGLYNRLSARQNLRFWSALYRQPTREGRRRVEDLLERVGLSGRADDRVETYSRGMKQRLHLARGLVHEPAVVVLDEPTNGLDPVAAHEFRALVIELKGEGRTVLITTHDMSEAEALCDRVSLIDGGRLLATEDPRAIGKWLSKYERVEAAGVPPAAIADLTTIRGVRSVTQPRAGSVRIETNVEGAVADVLRHLLDLGVTDVATSRPSLEEVYLHVIGDRGLRVP